MNSFRHCAALHCHVVIPSSFCDKAVTIGCWTLLLFLKILVIRVLGEAYQWSCCSVIDIWSLQFYSWPGQLEVLATIFCCNCSVAVIALQNFTGKVAGPFSECLPCKVSCHVFISLQNEERYQLLFVAVTSAVYAASLVIDDQFLFMCYCCSEGALAQWCLASIRGGCCIWDGQFASSVLV